MYIMDKPKKWECLLSLVEFVYNKNQQATIRMIPFEALYSQKCKTLIHWDNLVDRIIIAHDMLREMEKQIVQIKQHLKEPQDMQKSYTDVKRTPREF